MEDNQVLDLPDENKPKEGKSLLGYMRIAGMMLLIFGMFFLPKGAWFRIWTILAGGAILMALNILLFASGEIKKLRDWCYALGRIAIVIYVLDLEFYWTDFKLIWLFAANVFFVIGIFGVRRTK